MFTLALKPKKKNQTIVSERGAFFPHNLNDKYIQETFEEDTILLVSNTNQNVEIKVWTLLSMIILIINSLGQKDPLR